jgi:glycosyltransferase involved in cell wall biosynthesis
VLSAGRLWDEAKNLGALAYIAPELPWRVYVAGKSQHPDIERTKNTKCNIGPASQGLIALGHLDVRTLAEWYGRAAIFAAPARYEPFGLAALEAALAGCALVLGDIPSLREVWCDAARFVPLDDPLALKDALYELMEDSTRRQMCSARARSRAKQFSPERMAMQYMDAYTSLLVKEKLLRCAS